MSFTLLKSIITSNDLRIRLKHYIAHESAIFSIVDLLYGVSQTPVDPQPIEGKKQERAELEEYFLLVHQIDSVK